MLSGPPCCPGRRAVRAAMLSDILIRTAESDFPRAINMGDVNPAELGEAVADAVSAWGGAGDFPGPVPAEIVVERPKNRSHGDYTTNVAMRLAKPAGKSPRDVAAAIAARLTDHE